MTAARVIKREQDLSIYANSTGTYYAAMVVPALKGKRNKAQLIATRKQLLRMLTPNDRVEVGMHMALFGALNVLQSTKNLVVVVPETKNCKYAGIQFHKENAPQPVSDGLTNPDAHEQGANSFLIAASSQGAWGNDLFITIHSYKFMEQVQVEAVTTPQALSIPTTQDWGNGYPVQVYGSKLPAELDPNATYFVIRDGNNKIKLAKTQADALSGEASAAIQVKAIEAQTLNLSPAIYYTREPNTMCIRVFTKNDLNNPVKSYIVSKSQSAKNEDGRTLYMEDVITDGEFIDIFDNPLVSDAYVRDIIKPVRLSGGHDGDALTTGDMIRALRALDNTKEFSIKVIGDSGHTIPAYHHALLELAKKRDDCFVCLSSPLSTQQNPDTAAQEIVNYVNFVGNFNTSWGGIYAPHVKIYDEFNDREVLISPDSVAMRAILDTASNYEIWYPPAGNRRGVVSALDAKVHLTDADQDLLYDNNVNPIVFDAGQGIKIWGQKTLYRTPSMLDRINTRMMLITIGPAIKELLHSFLFEFNDEGTRAIVRALIKTYMDGIQARKGVEKYEIVCDETNNTPDRIDNHELVVDLLVCPKSSIEYIPFTIGITNNSISFDLAKQAL